MDTINTATVNTAVEVKETAAATQTNWMTTTAGILFWTTVVLQFLLVNSNIIDQAFADHIIYNILPLTGALAYFGLRKEMMAIAARKN